MRDDIRPDILRSVLEEDAIIEEAEIVATVLGAYLIQCLKEPGGPPGDDARIGCAAWYRARILEWCAMRSVRAEFSHEAIESSRLAAHDLGDEDLRLVVEDLLNRGADGAVSSSFRPHRSTQPASEQTASPGAAYSAAGMNAVQDRLRWTGRPEVVAGPDAPAP